MIKTLQRWKAENGYTLDDAAFFWKTAPSTFSRWLRADMRVMEANGKVYLMQVKRTAEGKA